MSIHGFGGSKLGNVLSGLEEEQDKEDVYQRSNESSHTHNLTPDRNISLFQSHENHPTYILYYLKLAHLLILRL